MQPNSEEPGVSDIFQKLVEGCFVEVLKAAATSKSGKFLSLNRAIEISRDHLIGSGDLFVKEALPMFPWINKYEHPDNVLKSCAASVAEEIKPLLGEIVAQRFLGFDTISVVKLVDEIIDSIAAVLRNEYIGLAPARFGSLLTDMKRVNIWCDRAFDGGGRNEVRLLGVTIQKLHGHLTNHGRVGLLAQIEIHTDLLLGLALFCDMVGSDKVGLAEPSPDKRKQKRSKPKYLRLENYADVRRWFDAHDRR